MKYLLIVLMLTGCGCGVDVGDRVIHRTKNIQGEVIDIFDTGRWTDKCQIKVYDKGRNFITDYTYGFEFEVIE